MYIEHIELLVKKNIHTYIAYISIYVGRFGRILCFGLWSFQINYLSVEFCCSVLYETTIQGRTFFFLMSGYRIMFSYVLERKKVVDQTKTKNVTR